VSSSQGEDVSEVQDVSSSQVEVEVEVEVEVQDVSSSQVEVQEISQSPVPDLSSNEVPHDELQCETPVIHSETPTGSAVAKLWLPPIQKDIQAAALGSPMSRTTRRG